MTCGICKETLNLIFCNSPVTILSWLTIDTNFVPLMKQSFSIKLMHSSSFNERLNNSKTNYSMQTQKRTLKDNIC